jgi:hypothetical protein
VEKVGSTSPYCKYNSQTLQLVVSSLYISAMISGLIASKFARLYGRKVRCQLSVYGIRCLEVRSAAQLEGALPGSGLWDKL